MPVYARKNLLSISPESLCGHGSHDEDFMSDPDQMIDSLPQPFRLINKIITSVCDSAWERIRFSEATAEAKLKEVVIPVYEDGEVIDQYEDCPAVAESPDGKALFLGLPDDLIVLDPVTHAQITSSHLEEGELGQSSELTSITTIQIDVQTCLIISVYSKSGFGRLHIYSSPLLLLVKDLDTEVPTGSKILEGCAFNDGECLGLTVEGKDGDVWLDILKLPKDSWLKALEDHRCSKPVEGEVNSSQPSSQRGSPVPDSGWNVSNLAKPVQLLRVTAPLTTVSAANGSTSGVITTPSDGQMSTIGVGSKHQLTEQHLKLRRAAVEMELATYLGCQPKSIDCQSQRSNQCSWLILSKRGKIPPGSDNEQYLVCSWSNTSYLCYYDLHKTAKDTERKPDRVIPFGADVTALSASSCGLLMAVGLSDGSVILFDEMVGLPLFVEKVSTSQIQFLTLPVGLKSSTTVDGLDDLARGQVVVISGGQDGSITALTLQYSSRLVNRVVIRQPKEGELQTMTTVKSLHNVLLIMSKEGGAVSLLDFETGEALCRVMVPEPYSTDRLDLYNVLSASDQQLLIRATVSSNEGSVNNTALLAYKLQSFPCLDSRWKTLPEQEGSCPTLLHTTLLNKRVDWLLTKHLQNSHTRQLRIQQRWKGLSSSTQRNQVSA